MESTRTYLPAEKERTEATERARSGAGVRHPGGDGGLFVNVACAFMHVAAGCAFVVAGALVFKFLFITSAWRGALLSAALYAALAGVVWLAGDIDAVI